MTSTLAHLDGDKRALDYHQPISAPGHFLLWPRKEDQITSRYHFVRDLHSLEPLCYSGWPGDGLLPVTSELLIADASRDLQAHPLILPRCLMGCTTLKTVPMHLACSSIVLFVPPGARTDLSDPEYYKMETGATNDELWAVESAPAP